jgi:hypothetical protein
MREYVKSSGSDRPKSKSPFLHLVGTNPKVYIHSNDPDGDGFQDNEVEIPSVVAELTYNFKQYHVDRSDNSKATNWFTFTSYPDDIRLIVETMRNNVKLGSNKAVGSQVTVSCCLALGLTRLNASGAIRRLADVCSTFKRRKKEGSPVEQFISRYLDMEVPIQAETGRKLKVAVTSDVKNQIIMISDETGLTQSSVGILCMYATLIEQHNDTPPNYRQNWQDRLDQSLELIECKVKGAKAIMVMLK